MKKFVFVAVVVLLAAMLCPSFGAPSDWQEYEVLEHGFSVALPSKPQARTVPIQSPDWTLRVYEAFGPQDKTTKFSVFVSSPERKGIYEEESMDVFLSGHIASMVQTAENGKLISSKRIVFRGQPAMEYEFSHRVEGVGYLARGVTFMIDGGHIRLSMWSPVGDSESRARYERFKASFQLRPIAFRPASAPFKSQRGVSFFPPLGWVSMSVVDSALIAKYSNLTRSMQVAFADNPAYTCDKFQAEAQAFGRTTKVSRIVLGNRSFLKLVGFEDVPKYNVRLTTVQYCLNSHRGAIVLGGSEEEAMFWRWSGVLEGAAETLQVR